MCNAVFPFCRQKHGQGISLVKFMYEERKQHQNTAEEQTPVNMMLQRDKELVISCKCRSIS